MCLAVPVNGSEFDSRLWPLYLSGHDGLSREDWFDGVWWWNTPTQPDSFSLLGNPAGVQTESELYQWFTG